MAVKFDFPRAVKQLDLMFGGNMSELLPAMSDIPEEFKSSSNKWAKLQSKWFFEGLTGYVFIVKDGINKDNALRHLQCIQGSWELKHEHKQAGVAYLMSLWFDDIKLKGK